MKKGYLVALGISICLVLLIYITARVNMVPKGISIDKNKYPITGIDVSRHSGVIDWNQIISQHISFVYIKATEGEDYLDPNYERNVAAAQKSRLLVGEYHFFRFNKRGKPQAYNFLSHIGTSNGKLTPVLDVEEWGNLPIEKSVTEITYEINDFLISVENATGRKMIIYTNINSYNRFIRGRFLENPIWICSFDKNRILPDKRPWLFWQHAHNGKLEGIKGSVDLSTFNGDKLKWEKYIDAGLNENIDQLERPKNLTILTNY